jgi:hypothetical protein
MTQDSARNLDGSKQLLKQAIGHLDDLPAVGAVRARPSEVRAAPQLPRRWWLIALALGLLGAAAAAGVLVA